MKKFLYLTSYSIKKKLKSKSFLITNIVLFAILLIVTNLDSIVKLFGGDFNESYEILVLDNTDNCYEEFESSYLSVRNSIFESSSSVKLRKEDRTLEEIKEEIKENKNVLIVIDSDEEKYIKAEVISAGFISATEYQPIVQAISNTRYKLALENSNIDKEELARLNQNVEIKRTLLDNDKTSEEEAANQIVGALFPLMILPVFMIILFLTQIIGGEINEEKTTRSMEIIISNVSSKVHLFSHLIADNLFMFVQAILLAVYGFIGGLIRTAIGGGILSNDITNTTNGMVNEVIGAVEASGIVDKLSYVLPITLILIIVSIFLYSFLAAVLASMSTNLEDYQQVQTPIMTFSLASFYLSIMASLFEGSAFIKAVSYVPLISFLLSPTLLIAGQITIIDSIISIVILVLFTIVSYRYGIRIYKVGLLNYSSDKIWKRMFKAARGK